MTSGLLAAGVISAQVSVADVIAVSESVQESVHASINSAVSDVLSVSESVQESVHASINSAVSDMLSVSESVQESVHASINSTVSDVLSVSESVQESVIGSLNIAATQAISTKDSLITSLASSRSDPVGLAESVAFLVQRSGGGTGGNGGGNLSTSSGGDDDGSRPANVPTDSDGDQVRDNIDGRMVNGLFLYQGTAFSSEFTNQHRGGSTWGTVSDRGGLNVELSDVDDRKTGLQASVSGQGGIANLVMCTEGFQLNLTAGDTVVMTCGSLTVTVLAGKVEVVLGERLVVTVVSGDTVTLRDLGNDSFSAENAPTSGVITATDNGELVEIAPGQQVQLGGPPQVGSRPTPLPPPLSTPTPGLTPLPSLSEPEAVPTPGSSIGPQQTPVAAPAPDGVAAAPAPTLIPTTPPPSDTETTGPQEGPPLDDDGLSTRIIGGVALGAIAGAAFIAIVVSLLGLARRRISGGPNDGT